MRKQILCTLGPASMKEKVIKRLEEIGVGMFRINLSHTNEKDIYETIKFIQEITDKPICIDTEGAQIRNGALKNKTLYLQENKVIKIISQNVVGDETQFNLYPNDIIQRLQIGDLISIDFNSVLGQVIETTKNFVSLRVLNGGVMGQNKAVTVDRIIKMNPLTEKDRTGIVIGKKMGIKHFALSFANK